MDTNCAVYQIIFLFPKSGEIQQTVFNKGVLLYWKHSFYLVMSMLNLPGELLKSGVNNVVSGGRRLVGGNSKSHVNVETLTVKGSPQKDAITTSGLATRSGYLMKRNEQGQFHRRFVCTVPHMFLYYYDNEMGDSPRGIIDLELYTKVEIEPDNETIKISCQEDDTLHPYYLQLKDPDAISDWVGSLLRDRYNVIRDERDAYRQLQDHFTGEMEVSSRQAKTSSQDMERLYNDVFEAKKETEEAIRHIATALSIIGISEGEMRQLSSTSQHGAALAKYIRDFINSHDQKLVDQKEEFDKEIINYEERISRLDKQVVSEQHARKQMELRCLQEKKESEKQIREVVQQMEQTQLDMSMAVSAKTAAETKASQLSEQKKVLVKEVKQGRRKQEESNDQISALKATIVAQQAQLNILQAGGNSGSGNNSTRSSFRAFTPVDSDHNTTATGALLDRDSDDEEDTDVSVASSSPTTASASGSMKAASARSKRSPTGSSEDLLAATSPPNYPSPPPEEEAGSVPSTSTGTATSYLSSMFASATTISNNAQPLLDDSMFRFSMDGSDSDSQQQQQQQQQSRSPHGHGDNSTSAGTTATGAPSVAEDFKLRCLRCKGTVEGPKYSTCKCAVPAMCLEDIGDEEPQSASSSSSSGVDHMMKATGSFMSNVSRRASILAGGGGGGSSNSNSNSSSSSSHIDTPTPPVHSKRSSISGMFGFGNSDK